MTLPETAREWHLIARPTGMPQSSDFELVEVPVRAPGEGEVVVRNLFLSVDPYMRGRMNDIKSYVPPFALGEPMDGGAVGEVVASTVDTHAVGDLVLHMSGWREVAVGPAKAFSVLPATGLPPSYHLGVLGMPGLTAYAGLFEVAGFQDGETVFVSGAAGAVGSLVGQLVKARGGRVVGSAGSAEKVRRLTEELGFDAAFDYKAGPVAEQLAAAAPDGIDVYFDNVGGEHLEAAIGALHQHGRIAVCGMIGAYNATEPPAAPRNLTQVVGKRLRLQGFIVSDHGHLRQQFREEVGAMLADGRVRAQETVVDGIESVVEAFVGLLSGDNTGKMVVRLA
ncbi:MAG: NADP-dependent oxidoreductase [Frankiales bacterium]|nr:MAG: NADP-dependent oxidoreductase [Frankiales bacterium]